MRRIISINKKALLRVLAAGIVGFILGSVFATINMGHHVDQLIIEKENLNNELASVQKELKQIEENLAERKALAINSITAHITFPKEKFSKYEGSSLQIELQKQVVTMLQPLNGKEINKLEQELIPQIVEGRKVNAEGRRFNLHVRSVIISQQLIIYVMAEPLTSTNENATF